MKNTIVSIGYATLLFVSASVHAAGAGPLEALAEEQARQSLAAARELIRSELAQAMRLTPERIAVLQTASSGDIDLAALPCASSVKED